MTDTVPFGAGSEVQAAALTSPASGPYSLISRLAVLLGLSRQRRLYGTPHHLSAYMLKDIGITHDDLGIRRHGR